MSPPNPILRGCHPDPSICRVGDTYLLVTSSFTMHPGLPIHRSRDLLTWELAGHVLQHESWIPLDDVDSSDGVWAPTIRHHDGVFYVVFTLARERTAAATYVCMAADPTGPWSIDVVDGADGIDPSLFFDEDGTCWFSAARDAVAAGANGPGEIWVQEFDIASRSLVGEKHAVWHGALAGAWVEAPHIYRERGAYHLIAAEGGTEYNHSVTAARASHPLGPWTTDPRSPLLTHRHLGRDSAIQNVGHGDVVRGQDGAHWGVVLGVRPVDHHHVLGRETFLVPMSWDQDGPVFAPGDGMVALDSLADVDPLEPAWVSLRGPAGARVRAGEVDLAASPIDFDDVGIPGFVGVRQSAHSCVLEATVDVPSSGQQHVGLVAFQNERHRVGIESRRSGHRILVKIVRVDGGTEAVIAEGDVRGPLRMRIIAEPDSYRFEAGSLDSGDAPEVTASAPHSTLSTETAGGFVGVLLGLSHRGPSNAPPAAFRDVGYRTGVA